MNKAKYIIPNAITGIRIIAAIALIFLQALSLPFFLVYGICGLTDAFDGFIARKLKAESKFGGVLDSVSDLLFYGVMAYKILPTMIRLLDSLSWVLIITATSLHIIAYIICAFKFKKFSAIHTYANKALGLIVFAFPFSFIGEIYLLYTIYVYAGSIIALYSAVEINLIHIIAKEYSIKNKSIFLIKKNELESKEDNT